MDLHLATVKTFFPATGTEAEWNAAYYRLEDYLRALHLVNKVHQSQIILQLLQAAAEKHAADPRRNPTALVLEEADAALARWFARMLPEEERPGVMGYVALLITNGAEKWPTCFLADQIDPEFQQVMQENDLRAGPDLRVSSMVPRSIDGPLVKEFFEDPAAEPQKGTVLVALITAVAVVASIVLFFSS